MADKKPLVAGDAPAVVRQINSADTLDVPAIKLGTPLAAQYGGLGVNASSWTVGKVPVYTPIDGKFQPSMWTHFYIGTGTSLKEAGIRLTSDTYPFHGAVVTLISDPDKLSHSFQSGITLSVGESSGVAVNVSDLLLRSDGRMEWSGNIFWTYYATSFNAYVEDELIVGGSVITPYLQTNHLVNSGREYITGVVSPATITSNKNDYADIEGDTRWVRLTASAAYNITGMSGGSPGLRKLLTNVGSKNITLVHASGSSLVANRFLCPGGVNFVLHANDSVETIYDGTSSRWRVLAA